jgi:hypothetical protein
MLHGGQKLIQGLLGPYLWDAMTAEEENAMLQWREEVALKYFREIFPCSYPCSFFSAMINIKIIEGSGSLSFLKPANVKIIDVSLVSFA